MKKILLIEDRPKRQQLFVDETNIDLESYSDILDNETEKFFYQSILNDEIDLSCYSLIISHKSVGDDKSVTVVDKLKDHCQTTNTPLVLFSGGLSVTYYNEEDFPMMELNSKLFYSHNLKLFLDTLKKDDQNILMLCYGENWRLNIALNILEKINLFIEQNDDESIYIPEFYSKIDIQQLQILNFALYTISEQNDRTTKDELQKFKKSLIIALKEVIDE